MAYEQDNLDVPCKAAGAVGKFYFVELSTSAADTVDECNAATDRAHGVSQKSASAAGESLGVRIQGITKVVAGAAISLGAEVGTTAAGKAITKSAAGQRVRGIALEAAGADGDIISILLVDYVKQPVAGIVAAGEFTTEGGDAAEQATVAGVVATDIVIASLETEGSTPVTLDAAACGAGVIDFTMSADPSTDHVISYLVVRTVA